MARCPVPPPSPAHPPEVYAFGRGRGAAQRAGRGLPQPGQPGGGGGWGGPRAAPPEGWPGSWGAGGSLCLGASLCRPWAGNIAGVIGDAQVIGGAAPILLWFVVACHPGAWPVCRSWALMRVRLPVATPAGTGSGGRGARGVQVQLRPPPGVTVLSGAGGTSPQPRGGWRAGAPVARRPGGGVGRRGEGGPPRCSPPPCPGGWPVPPVPVPLLLHVQPGSPGDRGRRARPGLLPVGQYGGGGGGGGEVSPPRSAPSPFPGGPQGGPLRLRIPRCRHSVAAHGAGAETPVGSG